MNLIRINFIFILFFSISIYGENKNIKKEDIKKIEEKKETTIDLKELNKKVSAEVERRLGLIQKKGIVDLSKELLDKDTSLKEKEENLKRREEQLKKMEMELGKKSDDLNDKQNELIGFIDKGNKEKEGRMNYLVQVISGMRPAQAAEVLSVQDSAVAVKILGKIDPKQASKIFNLMDKEISARIQKQYLDMKK